MRITIIFLAIGSLLCFGIGIYSTIQYGLTYGATGLLNGCLLGFLSWVTSKNEKD